MVAVGDAGGRMSRRRLPLIPLTRNLFPSACCKERGKSCRPTLTCPEGKQEFDQRVFSPAIAQVFATVSTYVDQHTSPGDPILVFPYQNAFGVMSRRSVAGGVLQGYLVNGDYLTELDLAGCARPIRRSVFTCPTGSTASAWMECPASRAARGHGSTSCATTVLKAVPRREWLDWCATTPASSSLAVPEEKIADAVGTVPVTKREASVNLGQIHWPADGADFLRFRFRANYPFWWKMRKPSSLVLAMSFADGSWQVDPLCCRAKS